ncbi:hypothetical protein AOLI_G00265570 [Acnodon oligacanthus]
MGARQKIRLRSDSQTRALGLVHDEAPPPWSSAANRGRFRSSSSPPAPRTTRLHCSVLSLGTCGTDQTLGCGHTQAGHWSQLTASFPTVRKNYVLQR